MATNQAGQAKENIDKLLKWAKDQTKSYPSVNVKNFTSCWKDGKAMYVLMHSLLGDQIIHINEMSDDVRKNFTKALLVATKAGVPDLLDVDDLCEYPIDRLCMITYLHTVYKTLFLSKQPNKERKASRCDEPIESENPFQKLWREEPAIECENPFRKLSINAE